LTNPYLDGCENTVFLPDSIQQFAFSSGQVVSCPFPYSQMVDTPLTPAYAHVPYGKYEFRDKIPHTMHHTNNWGFGGYGLEFDLNETDYGGNMGIFAPDFGHKLWRGPYTGNFAKMGDTIIFIGSPAADWCLAKHPESLVINNVPYSVQFIPGHGMDTVYAPGLKQSEWPSSLANSTASVPFYYSIVDNCVADNLTWKVTKATDSTTWRVFYAAYHDSSGTLLHFSKWNQPTSVTLTTSTFPHIVKKTFSCQWEYSLNNPIDSGKLLLAYPGLAPTDLDSNTEAYAFTATDLYSDPGYPIPPLPFNGNDTTPSSYQYHTFAMEWLPHEVRFLIDSVVVRRLPDRMIPPGTPYSDWITTTPRSPTVFTPGEEGIDYKAYDPLGTNDSIGPGWWSSIYNSPAYVERQYFEHAASVAGWPGFEVVDGKTVAHHMIDYVKVWDVPKDVFIPNFPQH
jgi:hypothetical protein